MPRDRSFPRFTLTSIALAVLTLRIVVPASGHHDVIITPADISIQRIEIEIGFNGYYKIGKWTPVTVHVTTAKTIRARLEIDVLDSDGCLTTLPGPLTELPSGVTTPLHIHFKSGRSNSDVDLRLISDDGQVRVRQRLTPAEAGLRPALKQSRQIWAALGRPVGFGSHDAAAGPQADTAADVAQDDADGVVVALLKDSNQLPVQLQGYDGLNALIISSDYVLDQRRSDALQLWVQMGGHLLLTVGEQVEAYHKSRLAKWVPVEVDKRCVELPDTWLSGVERFSGQGKRILVSGRVKAARLHEPQDGTVLISARKDQPMLVRVPYGFGQVTFFALDLDRPPLSKWEAVGAFCQMLLSDDAGPATNENNRRGRSQLTHSGITELATQLHAVIEQFPGVYRFSFKSVLGLILFYLLLIGPVDYVIVHRWLKKPWLTWFTFPVMIVAVTAASVWAATATNGNQLQVNQLAVVDIDQTSGWVRSNIWINPYGPRTRRYLFSVRTLDGQWSQGKPAPLKEVDLSKRSMRRVPLTQTGRSPDKPPVAADKPSVAARHESAEPTPRTLSPLVSWSGVPESGLGGMYRKGGLDIGHPSYRFAEGAAALEDYPLAIWSTKTIKASWQHKSPLLAESSLQTTGLNRLTGTMTHHLPAPIEDWIFAYGNQVFRPISSDPNHPSSKLHPHQVWDPNGPGVYQRELKGYLTRTTKRKVQHHSGIGEDILTEQAKYDPLNRDPVDLMRMLTFHEAAGGKDYTGLDNSALSSFDLSKMLKLDRAVLFGQIHLPAAELIVDGASAAITNHTVFVRIVMSVKKDPYIPGELPDLTQP